MNKSETDGPIQTKQEHVSAEVDPNSDIAQELGNSMLENPRLLVEMIHVKSSRHTVNSGAPTSKIK